MNKSFAKILSEVELLLDGYTRELRTSVQPYKYKIKVEMSPNYVYSPSDEDIRESLVEHVGVLPILATYFHQYVTEPVNLGKALEMLAIHDIGEIIVGDKSVFLKQQDESEDETREALKILPVKQHSPYLEFKELKTNEAKFARSIDKIAPDIFDLLCPADLTVKRLKYFAHLEAKDIVDTVEKIKSPYMGWSVFFKEFHASVISRLREILEEYG